MLYSRPVVSGVGNISHIGNSVSGTSGVGNISHMVLSPIRNRQMQRIVLHFFDMSCIFVAKSFCFLLRSYYGL
jgi:hypothetical protein